MGNLISGKTAVKIAKSSDFFFCDELVLKVAKKITSAKNIYLEEKLRRTKSEPEINSMRRKIALNNIHSLQVDIEFKNASLREECKENGKKRYANIPPVFNVLNKNYQDDKNLRRAELFILKSDDFITLDLDVIHCFIGDNLTV